MGSMRRASLVLAAVMIPVSAAAQAPAGDAALAGRYRLLANESDDVAQVVARATSGRAWPVRTVMRDRMRRMLRPARQIEIELRGGRVSVASDREPPVQAALGGPALPWTHPGGERLQVQASRAEDALVLTFRGQDATRRVVYTPRRDGRLQVRVTLSGSRLGREPIEYALLYARDESR